MIRFVWKLCFFPNYYIIAIWKASKEEIFGYMVLVELIESSIFKRVNFSRLRSFSTANIPLMRWIIPVSFELLSLIMGRERWCDRIFAVENVSMSEFQAHYFSKNQLQILRILKLTEFKKKKKFSGPRPGLRPEPVLYWQIRSRPPTWRRGQTRWPGG